MNETVGQKRGRKSNSKNLSNVQFTAVCIQAMEQDDPMAFIMEKSGLAEASVSAKRSQLRKLGYVIPNFPTGRTGEGGVHEITEEELVELSKLVNRPVDELRAESKQTIEQVSVRSQKVREGREANKKEGQGQSA